MNKPVKKHTQPGAHKLQRDYKRFTKHEKEYLDELITEEIEYDKTDHQFHFHRSEN